MVTELHFHCDWLHTQTLVRERVNYIYFILAGPRPVTAIAMRRITAQDATVSWKSAYTSGDPLFSRQEYVITLSKFMDDNNLKKIAEATARAPSEEYEFDSKLLSQERYQIKIVTKINDLTPSLSTEKTLGFRADSGSFMLLLFLSSVIVFRKH